MESPFLTAFPHLKTCRSRYCSPWPDIVSPSAPTAAPSSASCSSPYPFLAEVQPISSFPSFSAIAYISSIVFSGWPSEPLPDSLISSYQSALVPTRMVAPTFSSVSATSETHVGIFSSETPLVMSKPINKTSVLGYADRRRLTRASWPAVSHKATSQSLLSASHQV